MTCTSCSCVYCFTRPPSHVPFPVALLGVASPPNKVICARTTSLPHTELMATGRLMQMRMLTRTRRAGSSRGGNGRR